MCIAIVIGHSPRQKLSRPHLPHPRNHGCSIRAFKSDTWLCLIHESYKRLSVFNKLSCNYSCSSLTYFMHCTDYSNDTSKLTEVQNPLMRPLRKVDPCLSFSGLLSPLSCLVDMAHILLSNETSRQISGEECEIIEKYYENSFNFLSYSRRKNLPIQLRIAYYSCLSQTFCLSQGQN